MPTKAISLFLIGLIVIGMAFAVAHDTRMELLYVIVLTLAAEALIIAFRRLSPKMRRSDWQFSLVELLLVVTAVALVAAVVRISMSM